MIGYSPSTGGLYDSEVNVSMPDDVIEITPDKRRALLQAQANGQVIKADPQGMPTAQEPEPPTAEQVSAGVKVKISSLEFANLMPRATREFMLLFMESQGKPDQLAKNIGYVKVKAFDQQIAALRKLL